MKRLPALRGHKPISYIKAWTTKHNLRYYTTSFTQGDVNNLIDSGTLVLMSASFENTPTA
jgi:hypothetical protein